MAASFAEIVSRAVNRSLIRYRWPAMRPATLGVADAASLDATVVARGLSTGSRATAVSTLSVLAGRKRPCGSRAARIAPVPASATTKADALTKGSRGVAGKA
jgi:hypothetical protein